MILPLSLVLRNKCVLLSPRSPRVRNIRKIRNNLLRKCLHSSDMVCTCKKCKVSMSLGISVHRNIYLLFSPNPIMLCVCILWVNIKMSLWGYKKVNVFKKKSRLKNYAKKEDKHRHSHLVAMEFSGHFFFFVDISFNF